MASHWIILIHRSIDVLYLSVYLSMFFHGVSTEEWPNNSRLRGTKTGTPLFRPPPRPTLPLPPPQGSQKRGKSKCESHHPAAVHSFFFFSGTKQSARPLILTHHPPSLYPCLLWPHPLFLSSSSKLLVAPGLRPPPTPTAHPSLTRCTHTAVCAWGGERERKRELQTQKLFCFPLIPCTRFFVPAAFLKSSKKKFPFLLTRFFFPFTPGFQLFQKQLSIQEGCRRGLLEAPQSREDVCLKRPQACAKKYNLEAST